MMLCKVLLKLIIWMIIMYKFTQNCMEIMSIQVILMLESTRMMLLHQKLLEVHQWVIMICNSILELSSSRKTNMATSNILMNTIMLKMIKLLLFKRENMNLYQHHKLLALDSKRINKDHLKVWSWQEFMKRFKRLYKAPSKIKWHLSRKIDKNLLLLHKNILILKSTWMIRPWQEKSKKTWTLKILQLESEINNFNRD